MTQSRADRTFVAWFVVVILFFVTGAVLYKKVGEPIQQRAAEELKMAYFNDGAARVWQDAKRHGVAWHSRETGELVWKTPDEILDTQQEPNVLFGVPEEIPDVFAAEPPLPE